MKIAQRLSTMACSSWPKRVHWIQTAWGDVKKQIPFHVMIDGNWKTGRCGRLGREKVTGEGDSSILEL